MAEPVRRSGRKRKRNTRYDSETWDDLLEVIGHVSEEETRHVEEAENSAEEFVAPEEPEPNSEPEDNLSQEEGSEKDASAEEEGGDGEEEEGDVAGSVDGVRVLSNSPKPPFERSARHVRTHALSELEVENLKGVRTSQRPTSLLTSEQHTRGLRLAGKQSSRDKMVAKAWGGHQEDIAPLSKVHGKWFDEITLPSRKPTPKGIGGMAHSFYVTDEVRNFEATKGWDWYYDHGGRASFQRLQTSREMSPEHAKTYTARSSASQDFVMGPLSQQKLFKLNAREYMNINDAFTPAADPNNPIPAPERSRNARKAWLLNAGGPANCLGWAPNQKGSHQYLAISTFTKPIVSKENETPSTDPTSATAHAFAVAEPSPSTIQIWQFTSQKLTADTFTIDMSIPPRLGLVLCIDWGHINDFKWCPFLRTNRGNEENYLGVLAVITSDGKTRILDITYPQTSPTTTTQYLHVQTAAFESRPPNTLCTCLTWISSTLLAAGCANGYVAIWDLSHILAQSCTITTTPSPNPLPTFYHPNQVTYITSLTTCGPSRPHLLLTTSPSGNHRLTSLHNPGSGTVLSTRARVVTSNILWHDQSQHAFAADDSYVLRGFNVRNFFQSVLVAHEESDVTCLGKSEVHPAVLVGSADGAVACYNPLRRLMHRRNKHAHYRHVWWRAEWRRGIPKAQQEQQQPSSSSTTNPLPSSSSHPLSITTNPPQHLDFPNGLTRLTTSYAIHSLNNPPTPRGKSKNSKASDTAPATKSSRPRGHASAAAARVASEGTVFSTIYEEKSGVKCVAWNERSLEAGGWAAVGWGWGGVLVEDLCWR